jgi:CubicO group peptidase (beta-lactamase class C family)
MRQEKFTRGQMAFLRSRIVCYLLIPFGILLSFPQQNTPGKESIVPSGQLKVPSENETQFVWDKDLVNSKVDSIITYGIKMKAFPGAQVLVAKEGNIIFHKAYGYHTYEMGHPVGLNDLYDLASVTKIIGPLPALMKLYEEGKIDLDAPFSTYWKPWQSAKDKKQLSLREILAHQAGLEPYIVFLNKVLRKDGLKKRYFRSEARLHFQNPAYRNLYIKDRFTKKMLRAITVSEVSNEKSYRYSGLAFLLFPDLIAQLSGHSYEYYLQKNFYIPLGATGLVYNPQTKNWPNPIVPTEIDSIYRQDLIRGWVHDENASLMGGISGNAGLFGTARDLFAMMELYQNYGTYNGQHYFKEETVREFTRIQFAKNGNRRGLGFDKPLIGNGQLSLENAYPAPEASPQSFGHGGFTGTFVWADPKYHMVYIFLSNRVYPSRSHRMLYELNIRTAVQQVFYQAFAANESFN